MVPEERGSVLDSRFGTEVGSSTDSKKGWREDPNTVLVVVTQGSQFRNIDEYHYHFPVSYT